MTPCRFAAVPLLQGGQTFLAPALREARRQGVILELLPVAAEVLVTVSGYIDDFIFDFRKSIENPIEIVAAQ